MAVPPRYEQARRRLLRAGKILRSNGGEWSYSSFLDLVSDISRLQADYLLYVGSGVSKTAKLLAATEGRASFNPPGWLDLLQGLFDSITEHEKNAPDLLKDWYRRAELHAGEGPMTLRQLLQSLDRLQLAWFIGQLWDPRKRDDRIRDLVQPSSDVTSPLVEALLRLPCKNVVTTNYDNILSRALHRRADRLQARIRGTSTATVRSSDEFLPALLETVVEIHDEKSLSRSFQQTGLRLFYLHGSIELGSERLVLDRFDYARLVSTRDGMLDYVTYLLRGIPAVYVGFSLDDPSFNLIENRLFSLDHVLRPMSYAFVPYATREEHRWWTERNLRLIQYGDHDLLPELVEIIADVRDFLCWAEQRRPPVAPRWADRMDGYFAASLRDYAAGEYMSAIEQSRAALATTLFWGDLTEEIPRDVSFEALCKLIDVRIRLGLSHYKRRYVDPTEFEKAEVNRRAAQRLLDALQDELESKVSTIARETRRDVGVVRDEAQRALRLSRCSLQVLEGRTKYSAGDYAAARAVYDGVCYALEGDLDWAFELLARGERPGDEHRAGRKGRRFRDGTEALKAIESYAYAACQRSRIDYQFVDEAPGPRRRVKYAGHMIQLAERIEMLGGCKDLPCFDEATNAYVRRCLGTHAFIARAFAGRHLLGAFTDVIPTRDERHSAQLWQRLEKAITQLDWPIQTTQRDCDLTSGMDEHSGPRVSWRWWALRCRYLARAYALRWFLGRCGSHLTGEQHPNEDLAKAYQLIDEAFEGLIDPVAARDIVVTHLETARLAIITMYGRLLCCNPPPQRDDLVWPAVMASHHLHQAVTPRGWRRGRGEIPDKDRRFLRALAMRLGAYLILACTTLGLPADKVAKAFSTSSEPDLLATLGRFLDPPNRASVDFAMMKVAEMYKDFDAVRGAQRIADFATVFGQLADELEVRMRTAVPAG